MTTRSQNLPADQARKNRAVLACVAVTALAFAGVAFYLSGRGLDAAGERTCAEFASSGYTEVTEVADRVAIASTINAMAARSNSARIATGARALVPAATGTIPQWRTATRAMDRACVDAGRVPD
jgi:hypothetical protein